MLVQLAAVLLLGAAAPSDAAIQGYVRAEGSREPVALAAIAIPELDRTVQADARGFFVLSGVPVGRWRIEASALGYRTHAVTIAVSGSGVVRLDFELPLQPVRLPGVDVQAQGDEREVGFALPQDPGPATLRMSAERMRTIPGLAESDVLRALQTLPSVTAISDFSTALYVRGGAADQNLIQLDGMPLFNPYHLGGVFSAINTDAVATVELRAGALPARSGDRLSSVVSIHTREGGKDRVRVAGGAGLISTNVTVDGPLNSGAGSFLLSGRRTYLDAITGLAYGLKLIDFSLPYGFTDLYGKATHRVGTLGSISLSAYWDGERVRMPERMREPTDPFGGFEWGSHMVALNYRQPLGRSALLEARAGYSDFRGDFRGWEVEADGPIRCDESGCDYSQAVLDTVPYVRAHTGTRDIVAGADLTWFGARHTVRAGVQLDDYLLDHALEHMEDADPLYFPLFDVRQPLTSLAFHAEDEWRAGDALQLRAGVRLLHVGRLGTAILPRLGARLRVAPSVTLTAGAGLYAQPLRTMKDDESMVASFLAYDLLAAQPDSAGLARSADVVVGAEYADQRTTVRAEAYGRRLRNLVLAAEPHDPVNLPPLLIDTLRIGRGSAHGVELSARHIRGSWDLGAAYALSFAEREVEDRVFAPRYERRHQLDLAAERRWGTGVMGARLAIGSGQPFTPATGVTYPLRFNHASGQWEPAGAQLVLGAHNSARLPGYMRLDVSARRSYDRRWFGRDGTLTPYVQVLNLLNNRNALIAESRAYDRQQRLWPQLPVLPTFGVEWRF